MINKNSLLQIPESREVLMQGEGFAYLRPCEKLINFISNYTITFPDALYMSDDYTILPHGSVTIVFFYYHTELQSFLFGPTTKPIKVGNLANKCDCIFIIEFQPGGFSPFQKLKQNELADEILPFSMIDNAMDHAMRNIIEVSSSVEELLTNIEHTLLQSMQYLYPQKLSIAVANIIEKEGILTSSQISQDVYYTSRHLNRLFNVYLGMSMKSFSRLVRVNKALQLLNNHHSVSHICEHLGYYDVSHFIKDFKIVCHLTPQEYRNRMSDFYNEIAKF